MKRLILSLVIIMFTFSVACAESLQMHSVKRFFNIKAKPVETAQVADDEFTKHEQAILLYNENNLKASFDVLLSIKEAERTAHDWLLLGNILQEQSKLPDAIFMYQRAILVDPAFYKAYYNLGNMYLEDEKQYLAIENYRKANKANPEFAYAYYNLGCAYLKTGDLKRAKIAFLKAVELKNTVPEFHYNLAYTYKKLNKQKLAQQYLDNYNKLMESNQ